MYSFLSYITVTFGFLLLFVLWVRVPLLQTVSRPEVVMERELKVKLRGRLSNLGRASGQEQGFLKLC